MWYMNKCIRFQAKNGPCMHLMLLTNLLLLRDMSRNGPYIHSLPVFFFFHIEFQTIFCGGSGQVVHSWLQI